MPQRLSLILLILCVVLGTLTETAFPRNEQAFRRGLDAYNRQDYATALREWKPLAQQGDAPAQMWLAVMYSRGEGVAPNYAEAVKWVRKAADQGDASAQYELGLLYVKGGGYLGSDLVEAVKWFRKAADQGHASAQYELGLLYAEGRGGIAQDLAEAVKWYRQAADQGYASGQYNLGVMYENGRGVAQDLAVAQRWFAKAAETQPPGKDREDAIQARDRVARQFATAQPPASATAQPPASATAQPPAPAPVSSRPSTPTVAPVAQTQPRRALVIGNTTYPGNRLRNPGNDAKAMATFLATEAGFQVYQGQALLDLDRPRLVSALSDFAESLRRDDIVVFYFAGHGLERQGLNYLIPINFAGQNAAQLPYEAPTAQDIQKQLLAGEPSMLIMILDACRDLPEAFKSLRGRAGGSGLGFMNAVPSTPAQQVIMFATAPGTVASDGENLGNGTFTYCFLRTFQQPGLDSRVAFGDVVQCVLDNTDRKQSPFLVTSQRQKFVFK